MIELDLATLLMTSLPHKSHQILLAIVRLFWGARAFVCANPQSNSDTNQGA